MTEALDLDAYLERIRWSGPLRADLETLAGLQRAHMRHVPFENLDVLLGRRPRLDLPALQRKLVQERRGGYCFEHVTLFAAVLERLGFAPRRHAARVVLYVPAAAAPRTHAFLRVDLPQGRFVVDPGFGALSPSLPVPMPDRGASVPEDTSHWMARDGARWVLRVRADGKPAVDAWVSTLDDENPVDYELGNHYTATHPDSPFVNRLMLRALTDTGRVTVMNRDATVWSTDGPRATPLADRRALRALLAEHFGFDLPEVEALRVPAIPEWG
jgi:N-hydroxyarylamine O-acetyltransferase